MYYNNIPIIGVLKGSTPIIKIYSKEQLIWPKITEPDIILSCYYNGYWIDEYPWTDDTPWTD